LPTRQLRSLADGGYATKDDARDLPDTAHAVGRTFQSNIINMLEVFEY
jgi:hypothetical protein